MGRVNIPAVVILSILLVASLALTIFGFMLVIGCGGGYIIAIPGLLLLIIFAFLLYAVISNAGIERKKSKVIAKLTEQPKTEIDETENI